MSIQRRTRYIFFGAAVLLIIVALIWSYALSGNVGARICRELRRYGYSLDIDDLNFVAAWENVCIRGLISETDIGGIVEASKQSGFRSNVDEYGDISLITAAVENADIVLFLLGEDIELAFLDDDGRITPLSR